MSQSLYVATRKGVFTLQRSGGSTREWRIVATAFLGDNASAIKHEPETDTTFVALGHGHFGVKLHRTEKGWQRWQECAAPSYPKKPDDMVDVEPNSKKPLPWATQLAWTLESSRNGWRLWCGTIPGGLFMSNDAGDSWTLVESLWNRNERKEWFGGGYDFPGIHSICIDPNNDDRVTVGISCGGVWVTADAGNTWQLQATGMRAAYMPPDRQYDANIQDPHRVVQCKTAASHFWAQHHNGVFRSTDHAATWTEMTAVKPSSFGFAVAVHPHDPDTAWFVPGVSDEKRIPVDGQLVVTRTTDGGESFETLKNGLPQHHAYDLTFRHALDVNEDGNVLAFGTTTGSLWVSENSGNNWTSVTTNLPPIHAVHFA